MHLLFCRHEEVDYIVCLSFNSFSLGTPLAMDMFGWDETKTLLWLGVAMAVGGTLSMAGFVSVGYLAKK